MLNLETLTALQENKAIEAAQTALARAHSDANDLTALPSDYALRDLEPYLVNRRRARGSMTTSNLDSFVNYVSTNKETGAAAFVDQDNMKAVAVLNLGTPEEPGQADNKAVLTAEKTAAFTALLYHANGSGFTQKAIAEFLEDWSECVTCFGEDDVLIKNSKAVAAVRKITIEAMRKIESEEKSLGATKSAFESVQASSFDPLPTMVHFYCAPYAGFEMRVFALRLGVLTGEATPKVNLRIIKLEEHREDIAEELAGRVREGFAGEIPVMLGTYTRGN
jgi:uncharacterized protein YfdQ (DUF2303 family)